MTKIRGFETVSKEHLKTYNNVTEVLLPVRGTSRAAGYDFYTPTQLFIEPGKSVLLWSDVKAYMLEDEMLQLFPRSSIGIKNDIRIKNTVGIIDSDYYSNPKNDGNIGIFLWNFGDHIQIFEKGTAVIQGIFMKYLTADNCNTDTTRTGGVGSTSK